MRVHAVAETRSEPCASEAICSAQLAARLRQDSGSISQSQVSAQIWQGTQCGNTCPCHCHQYDMDSVPRYQQGAIQGDTHIQGSRRCAERYLPVAIHIYGRQTQTKPYAVCETIVKETMPCIR